jgi:hypothetical protein
MRGKARVSRKVAPLNILTARDDGTQIPQKERDKCDSDTICRKYIVEAIKNKM